MRLQLPGLHLHLSHSNATTGLGASHRGLGSTLLLNGKKSPRFNILKSLIIHFNADFSGQFTPFRGLKAGFSVLFVLLFVVCF